MLVLGLLYTVVSSGDIRKVCADIRWDSLEGQTGVYSFIPCIHVRSTLSHLYFIR